MREWQAVCPWQGCASRWSDHRSGKLNGAIQALLDIDRPSHGSRDREGVKELVCQPEAGKEHVEICGEALRWAGSGREVGHYRSGAIEPQRESGRGFVQ